MTHQATKYVVGIGLLAGALAIAPESYAQIQVTGGDASGEAAFFVPTISPEGNIRLFDTSIQQLRIQTTNGTTTTSVFTPAAADFDDANRNGVPDRGDTGTLQGVLTGVAFTQTGTPIAFSNRPTLLNFTLDSFTANIGTLNGTLIRSEVPGEAPLVFLPGIDSETLNITSPGFVGDGGQLQLGEFSSTLDDGVIALPPNLIFRDTNGITPVSPLTLSRRIKFDFEGEGVIPDPRTDFGSFGTVIVVDDAGLDDDFDDDFDNDDLDDDFDDDDDVADSDILRFVGDVNQRFRIQSVGTRRNQEFQIFGSFGSLDLTLGEMSDADIKRSTLLSETAATDYRIRGDAEGIFSFFGPESYSFASTGDSKVDFSFEQDNNRLEGRTDGSVNFYAATGLGSLPISGDVDNDNGDIVTIIDTTVIDLSTGSNNTCNFCGNTLVNNTRIDVDNTVVTVGRPVTVNVTTSPGRPSQTINNINQTVTIRNSITLDQAFSANTDLFALSGSSPNALYVYSFLSAPRFYILSDYSSTTTVANISIDVVNRGNTRYYLVMNDLPGRRLAIGRQRENVLVAYQQLGPDCKIFPGLVGLREIDVDDLDDDYFDDDISLDDDLSDDSDDDLSDDLGDDSNDDLDDDLSDDLDNDFDEGSDDDLDDDLSEDSGEDSDDDLDDDLSEDSGEDSDDDLDDDLSDDSDDSSDDDLSDDSGEDSDDDLDGDTDETTDDTNTVDGIQGLEEL